MNRPTQAGVPIKVDRHAKDGRCFVCGKTPEEIDGVFDFQGLKAEITNAISKMNRPASDFDPAVFKPARTRFEATTVMIPYDFRGQKLFTTRSFPHYELQYRREGSDVPVEPNEVVEVTHHLPVCPFCSKLFDDASRAAYKTIHAQDHCEND
jgi:hypothetical protein